MVKYAFEVKEDIVFCNDCLIMNSDCVYGCSCNLGAELDDTQLDVPRPIVTGKQIGRAHV